MLACAGLGDDSLLSHIFREQRLPNGVIHLVGARVIQIFTLEVDSSATNHV